MIKKTVNNSLNKFLKQKSPTRKIINSNAIGRNKNGNNNNKINNNNNKISNNNNKINNISTQNIKKSKKVITYLSIIISTLFLGIILSFLVFVNYKIIDYNEINLSVKITPGSMGINADPGSLNFGKNRPGGSGDRFFEVTSKDDVVIKMFVFGDMKDFIYLSDNNFPLNSNETKKITVSLYVPEDVVIGNYTGKLVVLSLRRWDEC